MSTRVDVITQASPSGPPFGFTRTGRLFLIGQAARGPLVPTVVQGMADFISKFGGRVTDSIALYDTAKLFFDEGGAQLVVVRGAGPAPVKATRNMGTGALLVSAKYSGAYGNAITTQWTNSTTTLTVVADGVTKTYVGANLVALKAVVAADPAAVVTVDSGTFPVADIAAAALATGTDDYANVVPATMYALLPADLGPGAVAWPGKAYSVVGVSLSDHAAATDRLAILSAGVGATAANLTTAIGVVAAYTSASNAVLVWPEVTTLAGITVEPTGFAGAARARAHAISPGTPPFGKKLGTSRTGLVPTMSLTDAQFLVADAARASIIQTVYAQARLNGWHVAAPISGVVTLDEAAQRDTLNAIAHESAELTSDRGGRTSLDELSSWAGDLRGVCAAFATDNDLVPPDPSLVPAGVTADPGYVVDTGPAVNSPQDRASGNVKALISVRLAGSLEFATITISASDAASASF